MTETTKRTTKVWAHRGASGYRPENTLEAFELAIRQGADGIEMDVHTSADGELIVMHDENVDRVTDGTGLIKDMTLAQLKELKVSTPAEPSGIYHIPTLAEALELMHKILKAQESDKDRELVTLFLTQELWHLLYLHMDSEVLQKKRENTASSQGRTQLMMQYIHQNFRHNLTLEDIAGQAMVSKSTALNLFRRYLHDTPVHYLVKYRLQEAAKLLATTEKKITVISGETGFENMDYFCKTFKKYYGRTPTEYRRKKQMDTDDREWIVQDVV